MTHNFANWEITQLLPEKNPYSDLDYKGVWKSKKEIVPSKYYSNLGGDYEYDDGIRDAWSWEDIRLYLLSKGYEYLIEHGSKNTYDITFRGKKSGCIRGGYNTYEECREAAILFTLNELQK